MDFFKLLRSPTNEDDMNKSKTEYVLKTCITMKKEKDWRAGQTMFNVLHEMMPHIANQIRGTDSDPFYDNDKIAAFCNKVDELWDDGANKLAIWWHNLQTKKRLQEYRQQANV